MSKNIYNPLNLDNPIDIDYDDMSDHEIIEHCRGEMNGFYGKKHTGAALENARTAFKGRKHTEETKQKMRMVDKSYTQTEEYKQKQRESHIGQVPWNKGKTGIYSEETLKKMGDAKRGKTYSPEARKKMSESAKGRVWSEEHKKNQVEAVRKYYENKRNTT
tara:strand:- start:77 stop:559 length:483 start_codon:yes stop_codon:yes gene_type:complete